MLGAADPRFAGIASGVNNAVARAASLLAVGALPLAAGLQGDDYRNPAVFAAGFRVAMLVCAGLLAAGGLLALVTIRKPAAAAAGAAAAPFARLECSVAGPVLHTDERERS